MRSPIITYHLSSCSKIEGICQFDEAILCYHRVQCQLKTDLHEQALAWLQLLNVLYFRLWDCAMAVHIDFECLLSIQLVSAIIVMKARKSLQKLLIVSLFVKLCHVTINMLAISYKCIRSTKTESSRSSYHQGRRAIADYCRISRKTSP